MTSSRDGQSILLMWLNLLGWQVELRQAGRRVAGVARHCAADGASFRVAGSGATRDEVALRLFEAAMKLLESRGERRPGPLLAA